MTTIEAGSAKLAGLQIDTLTNEKFALLDDLGTIRVPNNYMHATHLSTFKAKHQSGEVKSFYSYNGDITDEHFPKPTRILKPGDKLHVRAWKQIVEGTTTTKERMDFLAQRKSIYTGAQGASIVFEQKRDQPPKGYWYASFDKKERLWKDACGDHWVPRVDAGSDGGFDFGLGDFEDVWRGSSAFLDFSDE